MNSSSSNTMAPQGPSDTAAGSKAAVSGLGTWAVALLALLMAAFTVIQNANDLGESPKTGVSQTGIEHVAEPKLTVEEGGSLRDLVADKDKAKFDKFMADPENRTEFVTAFQAGIDKAKGETTGAKPNTSGTVQNILAYGFDRDHVWVTASYADMARGLIWGAVQYCKRYVPGWVCDAAGRWLSSMAQGYAPLSNHGVWGALYWNRYTGGRW
jgi:hypothetical protein